MSAMLHHGLVTCSLTAPNWPSSFSARCSRRCRPTHGYVCRRAAITGVGPGDRNAVVVAEADGEAVLAVIVAVQLDPDPETHFAWPVHVAGLRSRHRCPAVVLAVTVSVTMATWCSTPVDLGGGNVFVPVVVPPSVMPAIDDEVAARQRPELAVLSCVVRAAEPNGAARGRATLVAVRDLAGDKQTVYSDLVLVSCEKTARPALEELMATGHDDLHAFYSGLYREKGRAEGVAQGEIHGRAMALLAVLESRCLHVSNVVWHRILACTDDDQLDAWVRAAAADEEEVPESLQELMRTGDYAFQSAFARRYLARGRAEGLAHGQARGRAMALLAVLESRRLQVSKEARDRILACTDGERLDGWIRAAVSVEELL